MCTLHTLSYESFDFDFFICFIVFVRFPTMSQRTKVRRLQIPLCTTPLLLLHIFNF